jgi:prevent-host-death family protein
MTTIGIAEASRQLSHLVNQAAYAREIIVLTSRGQAKAVLLGVDAFQELVGMRPYVDKQLKPLDSFHRSIREALEESGYGDPEKIVDLVQDVRREMADERSAEGEDAPE